MKLNIYLTVHEDLGSRLPLIASSFANCRELGRPSVALLTPGGFLE